MRVLIAEDSADVAEVVAFAVRRAWPECEVIVAASGAEAVAKMEQGAPDFVILDLSLPSPDGFELCRRIREHSNVPILVLSVRRATVDMIRALDLGADDFLSKPFELPELVARLRALARRATAPKAVANETVVFDDLSIDFRNQEVRIQDRVIPLTSTEYRVLEVLARHAGMTLPHELLLERIWGHEYGADTDYLKVFVRRIRKKLGDPSDCPRYIHTQWGVGYRFAVPTNGESQGENQYR